MTLTTMEAPIPRFGEGIISFPQAARLIDRPASTLRAWVRRGLVAPTHGRGPSRSNVLSFHDLVSLEIVRRLRDQGVSLQRVRALDAALQQRYPNLIRPFAHRIFFTDGAAVWVELAGDEATLLELVGRRQGQLAWREVIESFAKQIQYDERGTARSWNVADHVVVDPAVQFGSPTIRGTRVTVDTVRASLEVGSAEEVADLLGLSVEAVRAAERFADA